MPRGIEATLNKVIKHIKTEEADALGHVYDHADDLFCNTCGEERTPADHVDTDESSIGGESGAPCPKDGLSGGAKAGIVIASVVAVGFGGFALFWFVIRKKNGDVENE